MAIRKPGALRRPEQTDAPAPAPTQEPDAVGELCVKLKDLIRREVKSGMQTHEVQDTCRRIFTTIDEIDAAARAQRLNNRGMGAAMPVDFGRDVDDDPESDPDAL